MPRTIIDIPAAQLRELDARCQALGISRAEGIRRAVHSFLNVKYGLDQEGFGLWSDTGTAERPGRRASREGKLAREEKA
jgi:Ribbon-helix-helix protein, copG family